MTPAGYFLYNEEYKEWEETHAGTPNSVPLYTNLAELTDEGLMEIFYEMTALSKLHCEALTKAILRKAQEK